MGPEATYSTREHLRQGPDPVHPAGSLKSPSVPEGLWPPVLGSVDQGKTAVRISGGQCSVQNTVRLDGNGMRLISDQGHRELDFVYVHPQPLSPALVCPHSPITLPLCAARWELGRNSLCCSASRVSVPDKRPLETKDKFSHGAGSAFRRSSCFIFCFL